jgi:hypothetical protein
MMEQAGNVHRYSPINQGYTTAVIVKNVTVLSYYITVAGWRQFIFKILWITFKFFWSLLMEKYRGFEFMQ